MFTFKQFAIHQDRCGMKVGTDGVLLGAWARVEQCERILDVGTGTGLVALMAAQRSRANIVAIDLDTNAVEQAAANVAASPWSERIQVMETDVKHFEGFPFFDAILCNPDNASNMVYVSEYTDIKNQLDKEVETWEKLSEELEQLL
jgi:tRNA1Val (adenine37-N6)-methyltransferase